MLNRYFQDELANLRDLGEAFSKAYPAVAPMLSGTTADPDVERLLEGVAFLTGLLRQKLEDEFPEIIHELIRLIWPHYLRPVPCCTVMAFSPKPTVKQAVTIPSGIQVASVPLDGTSCVFTTCYPVELQPLEVRNAAFVEGSGKPPAIKLDLELKGPKLSDWTPKSLRFFLAGGYGKAANLYLLLQRYVNKIVFKPAEKGQVLELTPDHLKPAGFADNEGLLPYPIRSFQGYRLIQEFFILPEKFLFLDLVGWDLWKDRGEGTRFEISFQLDPFSFPAPRIKTDDFLLSATPAINVFPLGADPIRLDHRSTEYAIRPSGGDLSRYQVYSVENVVGFVQGTAEQKEYAPFEMFNSQGQQNPAYHIRVRRSPIHESLDMSLSVAYPPKAGPPVLETLSIDLLCTNGSVPEGLQVGDIVLPTDSSPEFADFKNVRPITTNVLPPIGSDLLWGLLSHLSLNHLSLTKAENLRALLELYVFEETRDRTGVIANKKRISGVERVETRAANRLVSGVMMKGQEILLKLREDHFAGLGDLFLFASVLDYFLGCYASINAYTQLLVEETIRGERYQWPARVGERHLT
jgi:type VI secretion system protein ImpG